MRNMLPSVSEMFRPFSNPFRENRSYTHNGHVGKIDPHRIYMTERETDTDRQTERERLSERRRK